MKRNPDLGAYLKACRARLDPHEIGLATGEHRRVPGLRREEVADRAGVSLDYYARLEQGRQVTASPSVLDAISRTLRLTDEERDHVYALAGVAPAASASIDSEEDAKDAKVRRILNTFGSTPAIVCGAYLDVVAVNEAGSFLFPGIGTLPASDRNALRWMLLAPVARALYGPGGWEDAASEMVGMLRIDSGRYPGTRRLGEIVAGLEKDSPLFRRLWRDYQVSAWHLAEKKLVHPEAGALLFHNTPLTINDPPGLTAYLIIPDDRAAFEKALEEHRFRPGSRSRA